MDNKPIGRVLADGRIELWGYHPTTGYSTVQRSTTLADLARWLGTDEETALDWLVYKVAAFRGVSEDEARSIVTGG